MEGHSVVAPVTLLSEMRVLRNETVAFTEIESVAYGWMTDFFFFSACRYFKEDKHEEFNKTLHSLEVIMQGMEEMKLAQVKKVQLCGFLSRVLNGKRLDLKFENDEQVMPLMSALSLWESFSDSVADQALYESIKRLLFIQSAGVCLERGNYDMALEVLDKMVEKYQMPEELQMKLSAIVKRKDLYHQCFIQFSFTRLVETIKTFLDAVLKAHPSDFLLKAASKVALMCREAGVEGDTEDLDSSGPATQCGEDLKNGEDQQEAQTMAIDEKRWTFKHKKSLLPKHASPWKPESGKKQCGGFQRCSRREKMDS